MLLHVTANSYTISLVTRGRSAGPVGFAACGIYHGVDRIRVFAVGGLLLLYLGWSVYVLPWVWERRAACMVGGRVRFALCLLPPTGPSACRGGVGGNLLTVLA